MDSFTPAKNTYIKLKKMVQKKKNIEGEIEEVIENKIETNEKEENINDMEDTFEKHKKNI